MFCSGDKACVLTTAINLPRTLIVLHVVYPSDGVAREIAYEKRCR
jgi:hypothetical protein